MPNDLFEATEKLARRLGLSRSKLITNAVSEFLRQRRGDDVTEKLNQIYESEPAALDSLIEALQGASLCKEDW